MRIVANNTKRDFMAGPYRYDRDGGKSAKLNGFLGGKILKYNLLVALSNRTLHPNPGLLSQEVSRFCNEQHIATRMMQLFIFPPEIVKRWMKLAIAITGNLYPAPFTQASKQ